MDAIFEERLERGQKPFDGITIYSLVYQPLGELRIIMLAIVNELYLQQAQSTLFRVADWHEHDGYVVEATLSSWNELFNILASDEALYRSHQEDDYVRTGFFPTERNFYLRYYIPDELATLDASCITSTGRCGLWDLTCSRPILKSIHKIIQSTGDTNVQEKPAKDFFKPFFDE